MSQKKPKLDFLAALDSPHSFKKGRFIEPTISWICSQDQGEQSAGTKNQFMRKVRNMLFWSLIWMLPALAVQAQNKTVTGVVSTNTGVPVVGASVQQKGASNGTSTDQNGRFTIDVPENATLIITSIGFATKEVDVKGRSTVDVQLTVSSNDLDQVVVVGYGTQRRKDVTGSIVSLGETALREVPVANLQQALQGRAAGLEVQRVGNNPGAGAQIRIRGSRSIFGSNDPLFVVDGIPFDGNLNDINPDDVASIDVLKDASATAIYGSRGANGVILVTTKKGKPGESRVSYNGYHGISNVLNKYPVFNAEEYRAMRDISPWTQGYQPEELESIDLGRTTDWQDLMYKNGFRTDHNLSVSGGTPNGSYSLGGGYYKETTVLPGQDFTRYSIRAAIDSRVGKRIKVGLTTLNTLGINNGGQFVNPMFQILSKSPLMPAYNDDGTILQRPNGNVDDNNGSGTDRYNPLYLYNNTNDWVDRSRRLRTINNLYGELDIVKGLKYRVNLGLTYAQQQDAQFQAADNATNISFFRPGNGNTAFVNNGESWGYTIENILTYDKVIKDKHRINFTGLFSTQEFQTYNTSVRKDSITSDFVRFYDLSLSNPTPAPVVGGGESSWALVSYMARLNYSFDDRFLLTLTGRIDGSSRLAQGNQYKSYPAVGLGWNLSNENFMQGVSWVDNLKLRTGFGQTSNQSVAPYSSLGLVTNSNFLTAPGNVIRYNFGNTVVTGYEVNRLRNPTLDWEYTSTLNLGIDFGLLNNRITGSLEYYHQRTSKVLYNLRLPASSGVAGPYNTNIGEIENRGMELSISTLNIKSDKKDGFTWSTDFNLFFNRNKIIRLSSGIQRDIGNQLHVGFPLSAIYDYNKLGIWQLNEAEEAARYGARPGMIKLEDVSGPDGRPDGVINEAFDRYVIGDGDARFQGGMTHRFTYKGFDLSTVIYARIGGTLISQAHQPNASFMTVMDGRRNSLKVDYWTPNNPTNWFPQPSAQISTISTAWTTLGYYDATFVKIRSINLGYTFSNQMVQKIGAKNMRLYFTVDNVANLFSPYFNQTGFDPEGTGTGSQGVSNPGNIRGNAAGNGTITIGLATPPRRTFTVGANISF